MVGTRSLSSGARSRDPLALPTLVLARSITLASFHEEWPSPGGHPGRAADRLDRCPPKPLRAVFRSKIAIGKEHKRALIACARKLLIFANTVVARGTPWGPPPPRA